MPAIRPSVDFLVVYHLTSAGKQNEDLGTDETPITGITALIHDVSNNKIVSSKKLFVCPITSLRNSENEDENSVATLTEECQLETAYNDEQLMKAFLLSKALEEIDKFIRSFTEGGSFSLVTESQLPLRLLLHPETCCKRIDIKLYSYYYKFFDLKKEFQKFYKPDKIEKISDMLEYLEMKSDPINDYGERKCHEMSRILSRLISDGHKFEAPCDIHMNYYPTIVRKTDQVSDDVVVRARGLPWQATDSDINRFFRGLNIEKGGIALVLSKVGRRNGEALIRFVDREQRDLAIRKHKHHMGQRYIEVYMATGRDFIAVAGGETKEAEEFLNRLTDPGQTLVRMRGLPYNATAEEIIKFFESANCHVQFETDGILFVNHPDGRATGDAFVIFQEEEMAERALLSHRQHIGNRYIELFKSTPAEVNQVMNGMLISNNQAVFMQSLAAAGSLDLDMASSLGIFPGQTPNGLINPTAFSFVGASSPSLSSSIAPGIATAAKCFIRIKGMPVDASVADILTFLDIHSNSIVFQGVHLVYNSMGQPAGEAIIQMASEPAAQAVVNNKHKSMFYLQSGKRSQVDVVHCSPSEVTQFAGLGNQTQLPNPINPLNPITALQTTTPTHFLPRPGPATLFSPGAALSIPGQGLNAYPYVTGGSATIPPNLLTTAASTNGALFSSFPRIAGPIPYQPAPFLYSYPGGAWTATTAGMQPVVSTGQQFAMATTQQTASILNNPYYFPATNPLTTVIVKGLPKDVLLEEILGLIEGTMSNVPVVPDVKVGLTQEGLPSGEAFISFTNKQDADLAVNEGHQKILRNHSVEMSVAPPGLFGL